MKINEGDKYVIEIGSVVKNHGQEIGFIKGFKTLIFDSNGLERLEKFSNDTHNQGYADAMETFEVYCEIVTKTLTEKERFDLFGTADYKTIFSQPLGDNLIKVNDYLLNRIKNNNDTNA